METDETKTTTENQQKKEKTKHTNTGKRNTI